jgi:NADH-quinone oxidoreductase subunit D
MARTQEMGILRRELAVNAGVTGPLLRASGINYDLRKVDHYGIYDRFDFRVPLGEHGDVYDRMMVRLLEVRESIKILEAALKDIPGGPVMDPVPSRARPTGGSKLRRGSLAFI